MECTAHENPALSDFEIDFFQFAFGTYTHQFGGMRWYAYAFVLLQFFDLTKPDARRKKNRKLIHLQRLPFSTAFFSVGFFSLSSRPIHLAVATGNWSIISHLDQSKPLGLIRALWFSFCVYVCVLTNYRKKHKQTNNPIHIEQTLFRFGWKTVLFARILSVFSLFFSSSFNKINK